MSEHNIYTLPTKSGEYRLLGQLVGVAAQSKECANITERHRGLVLIITSDIKSSVSLQQEIKQFTELPVLCFTDWETLPYDRFSPHQDIIATRLSLLYQLPNISYGILIISVSTLMQRVCPPIFVHQYSLIIRNKEKISRDMLYKRLDQAGYHQVNHVMEYGEYAIRDALVDLYPMGSAHPYRIDFFDDLVKNVCLFDIDNKRTLKKMIKEIKILPTHEFPTDKTAIELFRSRWCENFKIKHEPECVYSQVSKGILPTGIEYWQPLFFKQELPTLFNYLPTNTLVISNSNLEINSELFWKNINNRFKNKNIDPMRPLLEPINLWITPEIFINKLKSWPRIQLNNEIIPKSTLTTNLGYQQLTNLSVQSKVRSSVNLLNQFLKQFKGRVIFSVESEGRQESLQELLALLKIYPKKINYFKEHLEQTYSIMVGPSEHGFIDTSHQLSFICERDIYSKSINGPNQDNKYTLNQDLLIRDFSYLYPGKPLVHLDHGVGRYIGLTILEVNGNKSEYLMISYADNTTLYVPVSSLYLINRYTGSSDESAPLHKLGSDTWSRIRKRAEKKVHDIVVELLDIYAHRAAKIGFAFKYYSEQYHLFCKNFPFKTTIDQEKAINAVLKDMCNPIAMDRLICGDVGFGKTEVAMRAAFIAVENGKQVALLVPTTLLAQQHYNNFRDRFANWPIRIEVLSRFRSVKEQNKVLKQVSLGKINILISTHKLLMGDLKWHNLGLLIVDEEHRFGVRHKECIKAIHKNIDILTLTATPIPRTLNMAMMGLRDLSIITTPPARRLAVKTFIREYDVSIIREAILREILRGGQIYYLYNDVKHIENTAKRLKKIVPEAHIAIGHGQMHERELEKVMQDFYHCRFNILVCTTIVETGIDVPNANTIIIEHADKLGLAQLHQLRGRVGRSHRQAYAWLLTPHLETMTIDAQKRLQAISSLEELGAGFDLATHDLEIRGAGEILGKEQSGQIEAIGFILYMEMLQTAVTTLKNGQDLSLKELINNQTEIETHIPALLPEQFIPDVNTRLFFYKRIANAINEQELTECKVEMIDRFGNLPNFAHNFFEIAFLRLAARKVGICKIEINNQGGFFEFKSQNYINFDLLLDIIQKNPQHWKLDGPMRLKFNIDFSDKKKRIGWLKNFLFKLKNDC